MGIKHFFMWFKNQFSENINKLSKNQTLQDIDVEIDHLMIDMNGIFHNSAQKVYEYGNFKPPRRLIKPKNSIMIKGNKKIKLFEDVCETVEKLFKITNPKKTLVLCVDGPAPISKQNQQRQRRFRSALESSEDSPFDANSITPGTEFMDNLTKYIDWYIRKRITEDINWQNIEVIFSNEKCPGEGEHKLINYMRYYGNSDDTFCINGLDADLIMLALGTHMPNFYIFREDLYDPKNDYFCIDIGTIHDKLAELIRWKNDNYEFRKDYAVNDFIFLCFMVGNDFLPHIPSIEIIESGIELILDVYKDVCTSYGHITRNNNGKIEFIQTPLKIFLGTIGHHEKENFERKLSKKSSFFPDPILEKTAIQDSNGKWNVNIDKYKKDYKNQCFDENATEKDICHQYLEGMQWVLSYYTRGVPDWKWHFVHHYAPPASTIAEHLDSFCFTTYKKTIPSTPFQQLLCVLPPKSSYLIPSPMSYLLSDKDSPLRKHCPDNFKIDLAGKRKEWEGIVILPMVDFDLVRKEYFKIVNKISPEHAKRNIIGKSFTYNYNKDLPYFFISYYGKIENCLVTTKILDL